MSAASIKKFILNLSKYALLVCAAVFSIFPFYWMFVGATNTSNQIAEGKLTPGNHLLANYKTLLSVADVWTILANSFKIAIITVVLTLLITSLAAFGFEKFRTKASERIYTIFLVSMMIPSAALMIPLFKMMGIFHLINSHIAVILPTLASTFLIFFFRQNFKSFPNEILESARIDGASNLRSFFTIVVPTMKATYGAASIYCFMTSWNSFMWPLVIIQSNEKKTMTLLISALSSASYVADYGMQMVALVIATIPMMLIFLLMQKSFVEGMTGSVKG